jgi:hypothetical protein
VGGDAATVAAEVWRRHDGGLSSPAHGGGLAPACGGGGGAGLPPARRLASARETATPARGDGVAGA